MKMPLPLTPTLHVTKGVPTTQRFIDFKGRLIEAKKNKEAKKSVLSVCRKANRELRKSFPVLTSLRRYYTYYRNICREVVPKSMLQIA